MFTPEHKLILVADDDPIIRRILRTVLENSGYSVLMAADGAEALTLWHHRGRAIDLIITDVKMPNMDGVTLYRTIAREQPGVKAILISGHVFDEITRREGLTLIEKPFTPNRIREKVREVLGCE